MEGKSNIRKTCTWGGSAMDMYMWISAEHYASLYPAWTTCWRTCNTTEMSLYCAKIMVGLFQITKWKWWVN